MLFHGIVEESGEPQAIAASLLTESEFLVSDLELLALRNISSATWVSMEELVEERLLDEASLHSLLSKRLLLRLDGDHIDRGFLEKERTLDRMGWDPPAALYHYMGKWSDAHKSAPHVERVEEFGELAEKAIRTRLRNGPPPQHFHDTGRAQRITSLPVGLPNRKLYQILRSRSTHRLFDGRPLSLQTFGILLGSVFGCHGRYTYSEELTVLKRTSPSGGSMHPIETYPLVLRVQGLQPGVYHYRAEDHSVGLLKDLTVEEGEDWAREFAAGQAFARTAAVLFILSARFRRTFWKYPGHKKAFRIVLMDAGHLSQTFYLVCTELGLGAFVTAAVSEKNIEHRLQIDGVEESAIGLLGCGHVDRRETLSHFRHEVHSPRRARRRNASS